MVELSITPVTPGFGAVVGDLKLRPDLEADTIAALRSALLEHKVLFFRDQSLDPAALTKLGRRASASRRRRIPSSPRSRATPRCWRSTPRKAPAPTCGTATSPTRSGRRSARMLHAEVVPDVGGDTIWVDMCAAYDALSPTLRAFLEGLTATHSPTKADGFFAAREDGGGEKAEADARPRADAAPRHPRASRDRQAQRVRQPAVHRSRSTGCAAPRPTRCSPSSRRSRPGPTACCGGAGSAGDLAFWDNRCTMHYALRDFGTAPRHMIRVALEGDRPAGVS